MAPRTQIRQSQALPVNGGGGAGGAAAARAAAAAAAAAREQNPPWRSSLDLVWSYSRSQAFYGDNIGTSPSFTDRRWAGPHRASIVEEDEAESDPNLSSQQTGEDDDYEDSEDLYSDYEYDDYDDGGDYEDGYEDERVASPRSAPGGVVPSTSTAGLPRSLDAATVRRRGPGPSSRPSDRQQHQEYYSSDDEHDHLGRRRSRVPFSRQDVRDALHRSQQAQQASHDSSAVESSSAVSVSATDQSAASDTGGADVEWDGEQLPRNAVQRSAQLPPPIPPQQQARRRWKSRNPPSAYRSPRTSATDTISTNDELDSSFDAPVPPARGLGRRRRSADRNSIDSDFSTPRPTRGPVRNVPPPVLRGGGGGGGGQYGAVASGDDLEVGRGGARGAGTQGGGEAAPLLGPPSGKDGVGGTSDARRLSRTSNTNREISAFSASVQTPKFIASQGTSTFLQSWFNTLNALIGVGVLALPLAFALTGPILGPILFLLAGLLTNYTGKVLARIMARNPQLRTYADIGTFAFGPNARWVVTALFCLELWAVSTALIILFGDSVYAMLRVGSPAVWKAVGFLIVLPTTFLPLRFLSPISVVGIISTITLFVVVLADGLIKREAPGSLWDPRIDNLGPQWSRLPLSFGLIMSGFSSHPVIPSLFKDMQEPRRFPQMLDRAYLVATVVYLGMGLAGYLMFGSTVTDEITRDLSRVREYPQILNHVAIGLIIVNPLAKFALSARPIATTAELVLGVEVSQAYIQEALARHLKAQREEEEAFMAAGRVSGGAAQQRSVPPRRSSGALGGSGIRRAERRRGSVDLSVAAESRRKSDPRDIGAAAGGSGSGMAAEDEERQEVLQDAATPRPAALFGGANPFTPTPQTPAADKSGHAREGSESTIRGSGSADPADAALVLTAAPVSRTTATLPPAPREEEETREVVLERALNEAGISSSEINPLAASAFSMRMAQLTAQRSPAFRMWARVGVNVLIAVLITLTAIVIPGFEKVMAFLGAFLAFASCVFGPLLAHMRIFHRQMPRWRIAADIAILAVSLVAAALGTVWSFLPR
ncbi:hypothetical protein V8E36_005090 [Tilletia maclaganii]